MGSLRFGKVAEALSGGLGLFAAREIEKERELARQGWDIAMADLRERRSGERETRQAKHSEALAATAATAATARYKSTDARIVSEGKLNRAQSLEMFADTQVQRQIENMYKRIDEQNDRRDKELENALHDEVTIAEINDKYDTKNGQTAVDFVGRMVRGKKRGFEVSSPGDMASLYQTFGIDGEMADELAKQSGLFGDDDPEYDTGFESDRFIAKGNYEFTDESGSQVVAGTGDKSGKTQRAQTQQAAAAASAPPMGGVGGAMIGTAGALGAGASAIGSAVSTAGQAIGSALMGRRSEVMPVDMLGKDGIPPQSAGPEMFGRPRHY